MSRLFAVSGWLARFARRGSLPSMFAVKPNDERHPTSDGRDVTWVLPTCVALPSLSREFSSFISLPFFKTRDKTRKFPIFNIYNRIRENERFGSICIGFRERWFVLCVESFRCVTRTRTRKQLHSCRNSNIPKRIFRKIYNSDSSKKCIHLELQRNTLARYFLNFLFLEREKKEAREFKWGEYGSWNITA